MAMHSFESWKSLRKAFFISVSLINESCRRISSFSSAMIIPCNSSSFFWVDSLLFLSFLRLILSILLDIGTLESIPDVRSSPSGFLGRLLVNHDLFYPAKGWLHKGAGAQRKGSLLITRQ